MRRLPLSLALSVLAAALLVLPAATGAVTIPKWVKTAKVTQYPVTIDAVGYVDHTWTWDETEPCQPGYAKTIDESLTFELGRPQAAKVGIVNGKVMLYPVSGGEATVQTELSNWRTTNYCPPDEPRPEPPEPVCKKRMTGKMLIGITPVKEDFGGDLDRLTHRTQFLISRAKVSPQNSSCLDKRPGISTEGSATNGWAVDPYVGATGPLGATDWQFLKLRVGETMKRTIPISGGCGKASFGGAGASAIDPHIRSCVIKGKVVVMIKRTGRGIGNY